MKLAIGDEPQTLFHSIINATKQAVEETRKEIASMKKALTDIDRALGRAEAEAPLASNPPLIKQGHYNTFGIYIRQDGNIVQSSTDRGKDFESR